MIKVSQRVNRWLVIGSLVVVAVSQFVSQNADALGVGPDVVTLVATVTGIVTYALRILSPAD